jgi:hypothetical protein
MILVAMLKKYLFQLTFDALRPDTEKGSETTPARESATVSKSGAPVVS